MSRVEARSPLCIPYRNEAPFGARTRGSQHFAWQPRARVCIPFRNGSAGWLECAGGAGSSGRWGQSSSSPHRSNLRARIAHLRLCRLGLPLHPSIPIAVCGGGPAEYGRARNKSEGLAYPSPGLPRHVATPGYGSQTALNPVGIAYAGGGVLARSGGLHRARSVDRAAWRGHDGALLS